MIWVRKIGCGDVKWIKMPQDFDVQVTVHRDKFLIIKPTRFTNFSNLFLEWNSTCFGQFLCPKYAEFHSKKKFEKLVHLVGFIIRNVSRPLRMRHWTFKVRKRRWSKGNGKVQPITGDEGPEVISTLSLTSALDGVGGQSHSPCALSQECPSTHCIGGWVSSRAGLDECGKSRPPPEFDPRTVQPVASCYTDCAILVGVQGGEFLKSRVAASFCRRILVSEFVNKFVKISLRIIRAML